MSQKQNNSPINDLDLYEMLVAAYPEKFGGRDETDALYDEVLEWADDQARDDGMEFLCRLMGRVVCMTMPVSSPLTGQHYHCIGPVEIADGKANMRAAIRRLVVVPENAA